MKFLYFGMIYTVNTYFNIVYIVHTYFIMGTCRKCTKGK